jgi:osmotically-inducible protein OsmY
MMTIEMTSSPQPSAVRILAPICGVLVCACFAVAQTGCMASSGCGARECSADAAISTEVRTLLGLNTELGGPNQITVQTLHGVVYLRGIVSTPFQIEEAGSIAVQARGVTAVENLVVIDNSR